MKSVKEKVRNYYKNVQLPWSQPELLSDTTHDCIVTFSAKYNDTYDGYKALDGFIDDCWFPNKATGWWQIKFPEKILIKGLTHVAGSYSQQTQLIQGRYYTSSDKLTPIGDAIDGTYQQGTSVPILNIPEEGIVTDTIYFEKTGGHVNSGIGELEITATKPSVVKASSTDYDFYKDEIEYKKHKEIKRKYYKRSVAYEDWTRPDLVEDGVAGGDTYASYCNGFSTPHYSYKAFDLDSGYTFDESWYSPNNAEEHYIVFYSPNRIRCNSLTIRNSSTNSNNYACKAGRIETSDDGMHWTTQVEFTNEDKTAGSYWTVTLPEMVTAKHWKFVSTQSYYSNYVIIADITFNSAKEEKITVTEATESDYDFYKDVVEYYGIQQ